MTRIDERADDELRPVRLTRGWAKFATGSCLVDCGDTRVLCTASVDNVVPPWLRGKNSGWLTAEYSMLPGATPTRTTRDSMRPRPDGRTVEIQRFIGRSLRAAIDLKAFGERTVVLDCDVLQADGGTRCAAITGAWVALYEALASLVKKGTLSKVPLNDNVAAVSAGIVGGRQLLDLRYTEDSKAAVDMNVVMTSRGRLIEVQASGESDTFERADLDRLLDLAEGGIKTLVDLQNQAIAGLI